MTRIRRINVSQVEGDSADNTNIDEIRPFGETAFYLDNNNKLTLMMFDGVRNHQYSKVLSPGVLYGSNADAGDGSPVDTIKLIPDAGLFAAGSDQYIVVDPTGGEPGHIHLRAGGTQDSSTADLYLGGELTCVRVSDTSDSVTIRTTNIGDPNITMDWVFDNQGNLYLPNIGSNSIGVSEPGMVLSSDAGVALVANSMGDSKILIFDVNGKLRLNNTEIGAIGSQAQVGSIITVPLNAAGDTENYPGESPVLEVPINSDTDQVQAGWIITFNGGATRTVTNKINADNVYYAISYDSTNPGGTPYPLTIQSADYSAAAIGTISLTPNPNVESAITWNFSETGKLTFPNGGAIEPYGMGWTGLTNGTSGTPVSIVYKKNDGESPVSLSEILLSGSNTTGVINFYTNNLDTDSSYQWVLDQNGNTAFPGGMTITGIGATVQAITGNDINIETSDLQTVSANCAIAVSDEFVADIEFNDDITVVQVGWTVDIDSFTYVVTAIDPAPPANQYRITAAGATFVQGISYTFANPTPVSKTWSFGSTGILTTPGLGTISHQDNDLKIEVVGGTDVIVLRTAGGDTVVTSDGDLQLGGNIITQGIIELTNIGTVTAYSLNTDNFISIQGAINNGVALRSTDAQLNTKDWLFGADGTLTLPGGGVVNETATNIAVSLDQFTAGGFDESHVFFKISDTLYESPAGPTMELVSGIWRLKIGPSTYYDSTDLITWSPIAGGLPAPVGTLDTIETINLTVGDRTWGFDTRGGLTTPNGSIGHDGDGNIILASDSLKSVKLWSGNGLYSWEFGATGSLTFPDATVQTTAYTGSGAITFTANEIEGNTFGGTGTTFSKSVDKDGSDYSTGGGTLPFINMGADSDVDNIRVGWIVTFASGETRTVSSEPYKPLGTYWFIGFDSSYSWSAGDVMPITFSSPDYVAGSDPEVTLTAGTESWTFDDAGGITFPDATVQTTAFTGNAATVDITNTNGIDTNYSITFVENRDGAEILRADVDLTFNSATNTLTAGNFSGDGSTLTGVATKTSGEWAVTAGTNTYSFTVPGDGTYVMWVKGNIPNGIITWNATASVSNTNVPAIGSQYAWNYTGGGSPILLTSIPDQIKGSAGTISTDATYAGTTSNRFDFGISNTSGSTQTIYYGYTKIS